MYPIDTLMVHIERVRNRPNFAESRRPQHRGYPGLVIKEYSQDYHCEHQGEKRLFQRREAAAWKFTPDAHQAPIYRNLNGEKDRDGIESVSPSLGDA